MNVTIEHIAKKAKVSVMTVSRVLNNSGPVAPETAEKIKKIVKDLNYHPNLIARSLSSRRTMTIGVLIPKTEKLFLDNYIAQILSGVTDVAQANNYRITIIPLNHSGEEKIDYLNYVRSKLFDGLILLKAKINDPNVSKLAESGFPSVMVNYRKQGSNFNYVDSENVGGAELAVEHLYSKGHRKIAFVAGSMDEVNARDRLKGYKNVLRKYKLPFKDEYVIYGDFNRETAHKESKKLLSLRNRPTAIFCSDDYMALGVIEQIKNYKLSVPKDIAIVGFDNIEIGEFSKPALTTVKQPMYEIGKKSSEALLALIKKVKKSPLRIMLKTELIVRGSA